MATRDTYTKQTWENLPSENTPISAERLAHMEEGISSAMNNRALKEIYGDNAINIGRKAGTTVGSYSTAEGYDTQATGQQSHAEGNETTASLDSSHAEGNHTTASGSDSHAEGSYTEAKRSYSHAEGGHTVASNSGAHAEGYGSKALGNCSHAEGFKCVTGTETSTVAGEYSHAEGNETLAVGPASHTEGKGTIANGYAQHVHGRYNNQDNYSQYATIIGGGASDSERKNIHTLDWAGNAYFAGDVTSGEGVSLNGLNSAIDKVFTSVSDGKKLIASAVTDKGVYTDAEATFATMAQNIADIPTGDVHEVYEGDYNLVPKVSAQSVETKDKLMKDNVTVAEIPFHEVSNETGKTVIIGGIL